MPYTPDVLYGFFDMLKRLCLICFVVYFVSSGVCFSAPEPAIVQQKGNWTMQTSFTHPEQIIVRLPGVRKPKRFWYTILTITNKTASDVEFYPQCELMTNTFQIIPAGFHTPSLVFEKIKLRYQKKYPFLEPLEKTSNRVLQGSDNTKDIAVVFPDFEPKAKAISIFISGLSNETVMIDHPVLCNDDGSAVKVFLRKTLDVTYLVSGDPQYRSDAKVSFSSKNWIMR